MDKHINNHHKKLAAQKALSFIENGQKIGLGTGSTAEIFIDLLADYIKDKAISVTCIATSNRSFEQAMRLGIPIAPIHTLSTLDIAIDGTDEFDNAFRLIKGGGGALLREKIIARASKKFIVIADESKAVQTLGHFPLPVEIVNYEQKMIFHYLEKIYNQYADSSAKGFIPQVRNNFNNSSPFLTDLGNNIIDLSLGAINDPENLARELQNVSGIVEHGLFLNETHVILTNSYECHKSG